MPVPAIAKTWQRDQNKLISTAGVALTDNRAILLAIKDSMKTGCKAGGGGTSPWTVGYSCSSTVAGTVNDAVDRWAAGTDLVWANAGSAHSWIVLKQPGIVSTYQLLLSLEGSSSSGLRMTALFSYTAGFTGGSTTARPTATDEVPIVTNAPWYVDSGITVGHRIHCQQSDDGQVTRIFICHDGFVSGYWEFAKAKNPRSSWTDPAYAIIKGTPGASSANSPTYTNFWSAATVAFRHNGVNATAFMTSESMNALSIGQTQTVTDDYDAAWPMPPIGLYSSTAGARGRIGEVYDLWWGSTGISNGDAYDETGTKAFSQLRDLIASAGGVVLQMA